MDELPYKLRIELAFEIHKDLYTEIEFFNDKDKSFIAWVGPLLKPIFCSELEYIFKEGDVIRESNYLIVVLTIIIIIYSLFHGRGCWWICLTKI